MLNMILRINLHKNRGYVMLLMEMLTISRGERVGKPALSYCMDLNSDSIVHTHSLLKRQGFSEFLSVNKYFYSKCLA